MIMLTTDALARYDNEDLNKVIKSTVVKQISHRCMIQTNRCISHNLC